MLLTLIININTKSKQRDLIPAFRNLKNNGDISSNGHKINAQ